MLLIYGPGRTGTRIAALARDHGIDTVLAGRNPSQVQAIATSLGLPWRSAELTDPVALACMLEGVETVINTAGPFTRTAPPLMQASITHRCHYLDLSNEAATFRHAWALNGAARQAGISIIPGAGFGTAAAEVLTAHILTRISNPDTLTLVRTSTHQSKTAGIRASTLAVLARPPQDGSTTPHHQPDHRIRSLDLPQGLTTVIPTDTGDPYAIARTTTINNVRAYASTTMNPTRARLTLTLARHLVRLKTWARPLWPAGRLSSPDQHTGQPATNPSHTQLWIHATNSDGHTATSYLTATGAAELAAHISLHAAQQTLNRTNPGTTTVGQLINTSYLLNHPNITLTDL
ncbi:MAG: saccharopine dehydrogenase NADP-binding domain-containing protein [Specibacter sp.]